ncbi:hypothetical protein ACA910_022372 [Epithemia clementina (nom. ined.)]
MMLAPLLSRSNDSRYTVYLRWAAFFGCIVLSKSQNCYDGFEEGMVYQLAARHTAFAMRLESSSVEIDSAVVLKADSAGWRFEKDPDYPGHYNIISAWNDLRLVASSDENQPITVGAGSSGATRDAWCFLRKKSKDVFSIALQGTNLAIDVSGELVEEDTPTDTWPLKDANDEDDKGNQDFKVIQTSCSIIDTNEVFRLVPRHAAGKALDVDPVDLLVIQNESDDSLDSQKWVFQASTDGYYNIVNEKHKLAMSLASSYQFEAVTLSRIQDDDLYKFCPRNNYDGSFQILVKGRDLALDVSGSSPVDGTVLWSDTPSNDLSQAFEFRPESLSSPTASPTAPSPCDTSFDTSVPYSFSAMHSGKVLAVSVNPYSAMVFQTTSDDDLATQWQLERGSTFGHYAIKNALTDLYLNYDLMQNGGDITQDTNPTNWCFLPDESGYHNIVPEAGNGEYAIDISASNQDDGAKAVLYKRSGATNQNFLLAKSVQYSIVNAAGVWEPVIDLDLVPAAAANLPDGRIVMWSAAARYDFADGGGKTFSTILDPMQSPPQHSGANLENTHHDMFCPGTAVFEDGRVFITGGTDSKVTTIYNPFQGQLGEWIEGPQMNVGRGYHSMAPLEDGTILTVGGSWSGGCMEKGAEVFDVATGEWTLKTGILTEPMMNTNDVQGIYRADNHMWLWTAPNGLVFHAGPSITMNWLDVSGDGSVTFAASRTGDIDSMMGCTVMFDIGKLLKVGGAESYESGATTNSAYVIDINNGMDVDVQRIGDMTFPRSKANAVVLPNGHVVVVGGTKTTQLFSDETAVLNAEIWDPNTNEFSVLPAMKIPRNYHSIAILLKDGRVLSGGGGLCGACGMNHANVEILVPPYLLDSNGNPATRPVIMSAPSSVTIGKTFNVQMDTSGDHTFAIMRLGAVTHSTNNDARRIPLESKNNGGGTFEVAVPTNPSVALRGLYFLFAMNEDGVPSVAETVSLTSN